MGKAIKVEQCDSIVCIIEHGKADKVVNAALEKGADGATVFYAAGTGVRQKLPIIGAFSSTFLLLNKMFMLTTSFYNAFS